MERPSHSQVLGIDKRKKYRDRWQRTQEPDRGFNDIFVPHLDTKNTIAFDQYTRRKTFVVMVSEMSQNI